MGTEVPRIVEFRQPAEVHAALVGRNGPQTARPPAMPTTPDTLDHRREAVAGWLKARVGDAAIAMAETALCNFSHPRSPPLVKLDSFARLAEACGLTQRDHFGLTLHHHPAPIDLFVGGERAGARVLAQLPPDANEARLLASVEQALRLDLSEHAWDGAAARVASAAATRAQGNVLKALHCARVGQALTEVTGAMPGVTAFAALGMAPVMGPLEQRVELRALPNDYLAATMRVSARAPRVPDAMHAQFVQGQRRLEQLHEEMQTRMQLIAELSRQLRNIGPQSDPSLAPEQQVTRQLIRDQQDWLARAISATGIVREQMACQASQVADNPCDGGTRIDASVTLLIGPDGSTRCVHAAGRTRAVIGGSASDTESDARAGASDRRPDAATAAPGRFARASADDVGRLPGVGAAIGVEDHAGPTMTSSGVVRSAAARWPSSLPAAKAWFGPPSESAFSAFLAPLAVYDPL